MPSAPVEVDLTPRIGQGGSVGSLRELIEVSETGIRRLASENAKCLCIGCGNLFLPGHMRWTIDGSFVCAACAKACGYADDDTKRAIWIDWGESETVH